MFSNQKSKLKGFAKTQDQKVYTLFHSNKKGSYSSLDKINNPARIPKFFTKFCVSCA